eukprot:gene8114-10989_t
MALALPPWVYVIFWISISCTMILFNKVVLDQMKFPYPMFLTTWHMIFATVMTQIMSKYTNMLPSVNENKVDSIIYKKKIIPVAAFFAVSLIFANKAYLYLSVSYIQMLKAFTPVAVLIFSYISGLEQVTLIELSIVLIISVGVAIASVGETYFSLTGFLFQLFAILAESSRLVLTNAILKQLKLDSLSSLYYTAPACACFTGTAFMIFEFSTFPFSRLFELYFGMIMLLNALIAFTLNIAVVLLISNQSALILTLAGIMKDILLVVLSVLVFSSPVTLIQYFGYGIAIIGMNAHKEYKKRLAVSDTTSTVFDNRNDEQNRLINSGNNDVKI